MNQLNTDCPSGQALAASITRAASTQTYYTIRFLVDRELVWDAYRAYAYFRWVDDWIDQGERKKEECLAFVNRQSIIINQCYRGDWPNGSLADEEHMLVNLIRGDREKSSGLQSYIRNMMAVMAFDAGRRGQLISRDELNNYTRWLAVAVTEAMHYFIGHNCPSPRGEQRFLAVTAAHITHMLRDTLDDIEAGYFNIPREVLDANGIDPWDAHSSEYRTWVQRRVQLARTYFEAGRDNLMQVQNSRCRWAGYAYTARFEGVLDLIERDDYLLRAEYSERKSLSSTLKMGISVLSSILNPHQPGKLSRAFPHHVGGER